MAGRKNAPRAEQERARLYAARKAWHDGRIRRRRRDNLIAGIAGGVIVVAVLASQFLHGEATAPAPEPTSTTTPVATPEPSPSATK